MTAPRRLAATLAVDVVGYSRLLGAGEDEAGTANAVRERRMLPSRSWQTSSAAASSRPPVTAALARLGLLPEAYCEARTGLAINPTVSIPRFRASTASDNLTAVAGRERIIDGLRKAGVSEA
jgi:hypothetical protein